MPGFIDLTALDLQEEVPQGSVDTAGETQARIKYAAGEILVSRSGGAYLPLAFSSGAGSAWVDGGNSFTSIGIFGTQNALPVAFVTSNVERARLTAAGEFLFGAIAPTYSEKLGVESSFAGTGTYKVTEYVKNATTSNDAGGTTALAVETSQTAGTSGYHEALNLVARSQSSGAITDLVGASVNVNTNVAGAAGTITRARGIYAAIGHFGAGTASILNSDAVFIEKPTTAAGRTITNSIGLNVQSQGNTGVTTAIGIDVASQSGASATNLGIRSQSPVVVGTTNVSGTESLRVSGGGALVDGTQFAANVSATCSINNSGGPIDIGSAANAQAINIGTGAAARPITIGNGTAGTSVSLQGPSIGLGSSNLLSINNSGGAINIGNNADAQAINVGTGASARTITVGNNTAGTTLTARAPIVNVAASTALQVNGSAGSAGQVLTSQGAGSPAIWAAAGASPLTLVSTTTLASVNSATISGLDGDAAGLYFITGALRILGGAGVPDGTLIMQLNGASTQYFASVQGYTTAAATSTGTSNSSFHLHPSTWCGGAQGGQIIFSAWLQASTSIFPSSYRSISGTSQLWQTSGTESGISSQFGGTWKGAGNLTSITISNTQAALLLSGPVSIYRLSRT